MQLLSDISDSPARRGFLAQGTDEAFLVTVDCDHRVIPTEMESDRHGNLYARWEPMDSKSNKELGELLISIGLELCKKAGLQHLDGEKPTV